MAQKGSLVVIDWGTSSLRAYLLDEKGKVLSTRSSKSGIGRVPQNTLGTVLTTTLLGWECKRVVMCGMIGSRNGLVEVPYVEAPVDARKLASACARVQPIDSTIDVWCIPGVMCQKEAGVGLGAEDVMRGEETQLIGCNEILKQSKGDRVVVLPGTHNKWALMRNGMLVRFWTFMTGEVFGVLRNHTILSRLMTTKDNNTNDDDDNKKETTATQRSPPPAFLQGVQHAKSVKGGLLNHLFSVRTHGLFNHLEPSELEPYLGGLLQGTDINDALTLPGVRDAIQSGDPVLLVGGTTLCEQYATALKAFGISSQYMGDTACTGLKMVAHELLKLPIAPLTAIRNPSVSAGEALEAKKNKSALQEFKSAMATMPLVAILRGITTDQVVEVGEALVEAGFTVIEVPLNSPNPFESIRLLAKALKGRAVVGAGTVLTTKDVDAVAAAGGTLIVSPNTNVEVIRRTVELGMVSAPGFQTPSEAFTALEAGAHALKQFPAVGSAAAILKGTMAVLPKGTLVLAVGGIKNLETMSPFWAVGARGFGLGSALYKAGMATEQVASNAKALAKAVTTLRGQKGSKL